MNCFKLRIFESKNKTGLLASEKKSLILRIPVEITELRYISSPDP
jgi:hypothetical protein